MNNTWKNHRSLKHLPLVALALLGAVIGYCYYRFVGCVGGACVITSNPYIMTVYGGVFGALLASSIALNKRGAKKEEEANS